MSEQIMWAVKGPDGAGDEVVCVGVSENHAWAMGELQRGWDRKEAQEAGYRCIRVKVTEVRDPRVEPRAGDVLACDRILYSVKSVDSDRIVKFTWRHVDKFSTHHGECNMPAWLAAFATATIIHAEGE